MPRLLVCGCSSDINIRIPPKKETGLPLNQIPAFGQGPHPVNRKFDSASHVLATAFLTHSRSVAFSIVGFSQHTAQVAPGQIPSITDCLVFGGSCAYNVNDKMSIKGDVRNIFFISASVRVYMDGKANKVSLCLITAESISLIKILNRVFLKRDA